MSNNTPLSVVLDNIRSALNVGAIFRTCDAVNLQRLYLCGITAYPPHNRIPKTALGATKTVGWKYFESTKEALKAITSKASIISVELTSGAQNHWDYKFKCNDVLIFGNEVTGVSKEILDKSNAHIKIPMFGKKKSLNVATSVGIVLYEAKRQLMKN